jgi:hypothetical protein
MSQYRKAVQDGVLVRQKRKLLRWWMWSFNRSEEDFLNTMKNRLQALRQEQALLMKMIPEHEKRIKDEKERIMNMGGNSVPYRDSFSVRREPVRLKTDVKLPKKPDAKKKDSGPKPLFNITPTK